VVVTGGERNDAAEAQGLLAGLTPRRVIADKAYDADHIREAVRESGAEVVIPPRRCRRVAIPYDPLAYKLRNAVERFVGRLKQCRRIATRYEKTARNFLGFVHLACLLDVLK
jgi:putative transposase